MDSYALQRFLSKHGIDTEASVRLAKDRYFATIYLHSLFVYGILDRLHATAEPQEEYDVDDLVPNLFKSYATFLLHSTLDNPLLSSAE